MGVDCTAEGKPLCDANGVKGFPTLKHGDPTSLDDYSGGRSYSDLSKFAKANLKPVCSPSNLDLCDDEEKKLDAAEADFKAEVEKLQATYQKLMSDKDEKIAEVKAAGLGLLKSVAAAKKKGGSKDEL